MDGVVESMRAWKDLKAYRRTHTRSAGNLETNGVFFILPRNNNIVIFFLFCRYCVLTKRLVIKHVHAKQLDVPGRLVPELFYSDFTTENKVLCERTKTHNKRILGNDIAGSEIQPLPSHAGRPSHTG